MSSTLTQLCIPTSQQILQLRFHGDVSDDDNDDDADGSRIHPVGGHVVVETSAEMLVLMMSFHRSEKRLHSQFKFLTNQVTQHRKKKAGLEGL